MSYISLLITILIVCSLILLPLRLYVYRRKLPIKDYQQWKSFDFQTQSDHEGVSSLLDSLMSCMDLVKAGHQKDIIFFQDKPSLISWGNMYVVSQVGKDKQWKLFYRGSLCRSLYDGNRAYYLQLLLMVQ